jgi:hypothetical protein
MSNTMGLFCHLGLWCVQWGGRGALLGKMFRMVSSSSINTLTSSSYKCTPWFTPFDTPLILAISLKILSKISYQIIHIEGVTLIFFGFYFFSWYFSLILNHLSHTYFPRFFMYH